MSQNTSLVSPGGVVVLAPGREIPIEKLPVSREIGLGNELARLARDADGPGGFFARMAPALDWLRQTKRMAEWQVAIEMAARMQGSGAEPAPEAVEAFRRTPKGVAVEIYWRCRRTCPDVTLQELEAVITEVNALDLHFQVMDAITDQKKVPTPSGSPPP